MKSMGSDTTDHEHDVPSCCRPPSFAKTNSSAENGLAAQVFVCSANSTSFFKASLRGHGPRDSLLEPAGRVDFSLYLDSREYEAGISELALILPAA